MRWFVLCVMLVIGGAREGLTAELVMVESPGCEWCELWDQEIGNIYHKTDEARIAPLRKVDMADVDELDLKGIRPVIYTPTFILINKGQEVGRINGYPGDDHFWGLLDLLIAKLDVKTNKNRDKS